MSFSRSLIESGSELATASLHSSRSFSWVLSSDCFCMHLSSTSCLLEACLEIGMYVALVKHKYKTNIVKTQQRCGDRLYTKRFRRTSTLLSDMSQKDRKIPFGTFQERTAAALEKHSQE